MHSCRQIGCSKAAACMRVPVIVILFVFCWCIIINTTTCLPEGHSLCYDSSSVKCQLGCCCCRCCTCWKPSGSGTLCKIGSVVCSVSGISCGESNIYDQLMATLWLLPTFSMYMYACTLQESNQSVHIYAQSILQLATCTDALLNSHWVPGNSPIKLGVTGRAYLPSDSVASDTLFFWGNSCCKGQLCSSIEWWQSQRENFLTDISTLGLISCDQDLSTAQGCIVNCNIKLSHMCECLC